MLSKPSKPSNPMIITFGPSRAGKSSFINTIARKEVTKVGTSNNESTTFSVKAFDVQVSLPRNSTLLTIFDVPGSGDSQLRISDNEIKEKIEETVLSISETDRLSAILVFDALPNQPTQLRTTLMNLEQVFGEECKHSTIVVLTKSDSFVFPDELKGAKETAEGICKEKNFRFTYLQNDRLMFKLSDKDYNEQFDKLMDKIKGLPPYLLKSVQEHKNEIEKRAKHLELTLPRKKKTVPFEYETQELIEEVVPVRKSRTVYEVQRKRRGGLPGLFGAKKPYVVSQNQFYIENETRYRTVTVTKTMDKEIEEEHEFSYYLDMAKRDKLEELRTKYQKVN